MADRFSATVRCCGAMGRGGCCRQEDSVSAVMRYPVYHGTIHVCLMAGVCGCRALYLKTLMQNFTLNHEKPEENQFYLFRQDNKPH